MNKLQREADFGGPYPGTIDDSFYNKEKKIIMKRDLAIDELLDIKIIEEKKENLFFTKLKNILKIKL